MGKYRFLVDSPGAIAEFRKDYHIPDDVHLSLAELDTTPWGNHGFVPFTVISIVEASFQAFSTKAGKLGCTLQALMIQKVLGP